jgi:signal transduction histidine kinase
VNNKRRIPLRRKRRPAANGHDRWEMTLEGIIDLSRLLSSNLDIDTLWDALHDYINVTFETTSFFVALYDYERDWLSLPLLSEDGIRVDHEPIPVCGISRAVMLHGIELDIRDAETEAARLATLGTAPDEREPGSWARSWLGVPLRSRRGEVRGLMALQHAAPHAFTDRDRSLLQAIAAPLSLALDNLRLSESERERRTIAGGLLEIGQLTGSSHDYDELLESLLDQFQRVVGYDSAAVLLPVADDAHQLVITTSHDPDVFLPGMQLRAVEFSPVAQVQESRQPLVLADVSDFPAWWDGATPEAAYYRSWLLVPMAVQEKIVGVALLGKLATSGYTQKDASSAFALARQGAVAFEANRLQAQQQTSVQVLQQRARHLGSIHRITSVITSSLDQDEVFRTTAELLTELFESDHCGITMINAQGDEAVLVSEFPDNGAVGLRIPLSENATMEWMTSYGTAIIIEDVEESRLDEVTRAALRALGIRSSLIAPLIMRDRLIGTIGIDMTSRQRQFTPEECETLVTIAGQVAIAVSHAQLYREALAANRLKSEFLANTSHELRTPLNSIIGYSDMLLGSAYGDLNEQQRERLARINASGSHLLEVIEDVLMLSRLEAGQITLAPETLRVSTMLDEPMRAIAPEASAKSLDILTSASPDEPAVRADRQYLHLIVLNLLGNAVKFTPAGGITVELAPVTTPDVTIPKRLRVPDGDWLAIRVRDTGIGIRPEDQEMIFESFRQVDSSPEREYEGSGLGLAITRRLVELHGGTIWVESALGAGSTFVVLLPAASAD